MQEFAFWNTVPPRALGGVFELRTYGLKPGKLLEWEGHWRKGLEVRKNFMEPIGAWFTQIGTLNRVYHIWQFPGNVQFSWVNCRFAVSQGKSRTLLESDL